jgi:hypothetical protein
MEQARVEAGFGVARIAADRSSVSKLEQFPGDAVGFDEIFGGELL